MLYRVRRPGPPLDAVVEWVWVCRNDRRPHALERVLPSGSAQLIINLQEDQTRVYDPDRNYRCVTSPGTVFGGLRTTYQVIDSAEQEHVAGVVFKAAGSRTFVPVPAHEATNVDVPLEALWGRCDTVQLRERLLESESPEAVLDALEVALLARWTPTRPHPAVALALSMFDRAPETASVGEVTRHVGLSSKRFIERFKADVGVTPKRYCRIGRFQRALARVHRGESVDWIAVALDGGYFDQAHFIHDFRSFTGLTPTEYQARLYAVCEPRQISTRRCAVGQGTIGA